MLLPHPRLVKFIGAGLTREYPRIEHPNRFPSKVIGNSFFVDQEEEVLFTVQEYLTGGSVDTALWHTPHGGTTSPISWKVKLQWARDSAEGLAYIHQRDHVHRDFKTPNLLYDATTMRAKIADFGMSRSVRKTAGLCTPPSWRGEPPFSPGSDEEGVGSQGKVKEEVVGSLDSQLTSECGSTEW